VDEKLDDLVLKALASQPDRRYLSAEEMEQALRNYLDPVPVKELASGDTSRGTLDFLLRRMQRLRQPPTSSIP
jgi:serine/threonine protein kinase